MLTRWQKIFLFLFILLLPSQLAVHFWPGFSVLRGLYVDYLSPTLYLTDILLIILILLEIKYFWRIPKTSVSLKFILLIIFIMLNISFSYQPFFTLYNYTRISLLVLFIHLYISKKDLASNSLVPLTVSVIWICLLALWQFLLRHSVGGVWYWVGERPLYLSMSNVAKVSLWGQMGQLGLLLRPYATFPHPNALAGYLLACYFYVSNKNKLLLILITATILITFSRTTLFVFVLLNLVVFLKKKFIYFAPLLLIPFFVPGNPLSLAERQFLYVESLSVICRHAVFGTGLGNYLLSSPNYLLQPVHNIFLLLLAELGLPLCLFLIYLLKKYYLGITYVLMPVLLTGLTDHYWLTSHQNMFLIFFLITLSYNRLHVGRATF